MDLLKIVCTALIIIAPFNFILGILSILDERKIFKIIFTIFSAIGLLLILVISLLTDIFKYILSEPTIGAIVIIVISIIIFVIAYFTIQKFRNTKKDK